jgi:hypothetical protein
VPEITVAGTDRLRKGDLPASTLEVNQAHLNFYASSVADSFAWYLVMLQRAIAAGELIQINTVQASLGGDLIRITYPQTGEQLARCAYERLLAQGAGRVTSKRTSVHDEARSHHAAALTLQAPGRTEEAAELARRHPATRRSL